jgi:hypothetical protein
LIPPDQSNPTFSLSPELPLDRCRRDILKKIAEDEETDYSSSSSESDSDSGEETPPPPPTTILSRAIFSAVTGAEKTVPDAVEDGLF